MNIHNSITAGTFGVLIMDKTSLDIKYVLLLLGIDYI